MAIFPYVSESDLKLADRDIIKSGFNLHKITAYSPKTARVSQAMGGHLRFTSSLNPRLRELAILQVAYTGRSPYEWVHHLEIAEDLGINENDLRAISAESEGQHSDLDQISRAVLKAAREMTQGITSSPATMKQLQASLSREALVDLIYAIGFYVGFIRITASLQIEVESGYQKYLNRFPMPDRAVDWMQHDGI